MDFEDPELEPTILPVDSRLALSGSSSEFRDLFERLAAVAPQKEKIPGTSLISLEAKDDTVRLTATDGTQTLILETNTIRIGREGRARIPVHKFKQIFLLAPDARVSVVLVGDTATVSSGRATWNVSLPATDRIPAIPDASDIELHVLARRPLYKALSSVKRALPGVGGRKSLEQINFAGGNVTASDGYRLLRRRVEGLPEHLNFSLPRETAEELMRSLSSGSDSDVRIGADDKSSLFVYRADGVTLLSSQLTLEFPDLEAHLIAPVLTNQNSLVVDSVELRNLVKRVRVFADPEYASVTLKVAKSKDEWTLTVLTRDRSGNSASEIIEIQWWGPEEPAEVTVNHKFLTDLLDAYGSSQAIIKIGERAKTKASPIAIKDDEKGFVGVVQQSISR